MISNNLLTPTPTPNRDQLISRDAESLRVLSDWLADPRFEGLHPILLRMGSRLGDFVRQANTK
jgi:hypothetical protein